MRGVVPRPAQLPDPVASRCNGQRTPLNPFTLSPFTQNANTPNRSLAIIAVFARFCRRWREPSDGVLGKKTRFVHVHVPTLGHAVFSYWDVSWWRPFLTLLRKKINFLRYVAYECVMWSFPIHELVVYWLKFINLYRIYFVGLTKTKIWIDINSWRE